MGFMKKILRYFTAAALCFALAATAAACKEKKSSDAGKGKEPEKNDNGYVSKVRYEAEHPYVEHNGEPYLMLPLQMRLDWIYEDTGGDIAFIEENFADAAELGFQSVCIPIYWATIEPSQGEFNFSQMSIYYKYLEKYDLKVEWLWFGTNVCGSGGCAPQWVKNAPDTYKRVVPEGYKGDGVWFDFSCKETLEAEKTAVGEMMKWLAQNDKQRRCVMIQVNNEVDQGANNFQPDQTDEAQNFVGQWWQTKEGHDKYCWVNGQREEFFAYESALGDVIHSSPYNCVTRINVSGAGRNTIPELKLDYEDILDTSGIDIVGVDCYATKWDSLDQYITKVSGNVTHLAEASGNYEFGYNMAKMLEMGAGMMIYCHRDDRDHFGFYVNNGRDSKEWTERPSTGEDRKFMNMIKKVSSKLAFAVPNGEVLEFNGEHLEGGMDVTSSLNGFSIRFTQGNDGLGIAFPVGDKEWILLANRDSSVFEFDSSAKVAGAAFGGYENGKWKVQNTSAVDGNKVTVNAYQAVKVILE